MIKKSTCNVEDLGLIPGLGRSPGEGHGNPLQDSCLENPHGQRTLEGYSPWVEHDIATKHSIVSNFSKFGDTVLDGCFINIIIPIVYQKLLIQVPFP